MVWPPLCPDSALPPTNSLRDETPVPRTTIRKTFQTPPPPIPSRGSRDRLRHPPERESSPGGLYAAMVASGVMFHVGAGIPGVAPHYISPPSTFNVLLGSSWFDKPWFLSEGKLAAVRIIPSSWGCPTNV
ncbi:hypothetical protein QYE76_019205 [Lolium multiflorum]|uniref:Uncharacterized protein n=1 Tax=Lolium multiflorum TaxID=4521 RepID=A0AAD8R2N2_LOLMU|nr:hypothetical protein QYE76_019205 [Lolium multiflorum]